MIPTVENKKMSLLLQIEDDPAYQELVSRRLEGRFIIEVASSLHEGLAKIKDGKYDAILLDPGLPDSSQHETFRRVKESKPDAAIVILTGNNDEDFVRRQIQDCASGVLVKGKNDIEPLAFAAQIKRAIYTHRVCRGLDSATGTYA